MSVTLPSCYFPPISYFLYLEKYTEGQLEIFENFQKQTYRNRAVILGANGKLDLIVPIQHNGKRIMKDLEIAYDFDWQKNHLKSIISAYRRSPYFEFYESQFVPLFEFKPTFLVDLNERILQTIFSILKWEPKLDPTIAYHKEVEGMDARMKFSPKKPFPYSLTEYIQVFEDRFPFQENLSIFDLICNLGPESMNYIKENSNTI